MLELQSIRKIYFLHGIISILILLAGIATNYFTHSERSFKKYVPADITKLNSEYNHLECSKAYVNVHSNVPDEGIVCCMDADVDDGAGDGMTGLLSGVIDYVIGNNALCASTPVNMPFIRVLTKFPHSWLIVLVPSIIQLLLTPFISKNKVRRVNGREVAKTSLASIMYRVLCYVLVMLIRGYILYRCCDAIEDFFFETNNSSWNDCWYASVIHSRGVGNAPCRGIYFDFSDHIVFFYAHMLPIVLFETAAILSSPLWVLSKVCFLEHPLIVGILLYSSYVTTIVLLSAFRTAKYFHTPLETLMGYVVSLSIQIPLSKYILYIYFVCCYFMKM